MSPATKELRRQCIMMVPVPVGRAARPAELTTLWPSLDIDAALLQLELL